MTTEKDSHDTTCTHAQAAPTAKAYSTWEARIPWLCSKLQWTPPQVSFYPPKNPFTSYFCVYYCTMRGARLRHGIIIIVISMAWFDIPPPIVWKHSPSGSVLLTGFGALTHGYRPQMIFFRGNYVICY